MFLVRHVSLRLSVPLYSLVSAVVARPVTPTRRTVQFGSILHRSFQFVAIVRLIHSRVVFAATVTTLAHDQSWEPVCAFETLACFHLRIEGVGLVVQIQESNEA